MSNLTYNERSWAIDLASDINQYAQTHKRAIARAGGELTLKRKGETSLFPDVILYGDTHASRVRHGWELKLPDTPITDPEFIDNARKKAVRFGVNSFLLWNVKQAVLYASEDGTNFEILYEWDAIDVNSRGEVKAKEELWKELLNTILNDLNGFFENGQLRSSSISEVLNDNFFASILDEYKGVCADNIRAMAARRGSIAAVVSQWWLNNAAEYGSRPARNIDYEILATVVLTNWLNRFLFSHYLKRFNAVASAIEAIDIETGIEDALDIFNGVTDLCNFLQVYQLEIGAEHIGNETWLALCEVNMFLTGLNLDDVPQEMLQQVIERTLEASRRKAAGQYATPTNLAKLLVFLATENREGFIVDPCCGTGTIARAAYDLKRRCDFTVADSLNTVWASDKYQFPLQLCTLSLADPEAMGHVTHVFKHDVFDLATEKEINFIDPNNGDHITYPLPVFDTVVSNLPFVRFEDLRRTNPDVQDVIDRNDDFDIAGTSDLLAIIIMHIRHLVRDGGRIGIIVSNSWLSSEWGATFREAVTKEFQIKMVVTSGTGRWFNNADVVTNIILLEKTPTKETSQTQFITTLESIEIWNSENIEEVWRTSLTTRMDTTNKLARYVHYTAEEMTTINRFIVGWSLFFTDVKWLPAITNILTPISDLFRVYRGERRGWNDLFYPEAGHSIEADYIKPVLRTPRDISSFTATTEQEAFCCSKSKEELTALGHKGALHWIERFENVTNGNGDPLPEVLKRANHYWYEMKADKLADLVLSTNPANRIFIARLPDKGFVDQRLIPFAAVNEEIDVELCHALLNSALGMLMIEASGFGRGLGALDLSARKIREGFFMLNPSLLDRKAAEIIKEKFEAFKTRDVKPIKEELASEDRATFDKAVLEAFGIEDYEERIRKAVLDIYGIRTAVFA